MPAGRQEAGWHWGATAECALGEMPWHMEMAAWHLGAVRVRLEAPSWLLAALRRIWGEQSMAPELAVAEERARVGPSERTGQVRVEHELGAAEDVPLGDAVPYLDQVLHSYVRKHHRTQVALLHAAAVERDGRGWLLVGPSGAGKSALSLAALRHGFRYLSDELVFFDGQQVWGVPRSVQTDWRPPGDSARYPGGGGYLVPVPPVQVCPRPLPVARVAVCFVARQPAEMNEATRAVASPDSLASPARLAPVAALAELLAACWRCPKPDFGPLCAAAYRLEWCCPDAAIVGLPGSMP